MKINEKHLSHFSTRQDPAPDKEGWLSKKGELNTSYQKRWCVLKGNLFFYFEKRSDKEPIGVIILEDCSVQLAEGADSSATFSIHFAGESSRVYKLTADDDETCMAWVKQLSSCSYRYVELMVEALEKELEKELEMLKKEQYACEDLIEKQNLEYMEDHFSLHTNKSGSVDNIFSLTDNKNNADQTLANKKHNTLNRSWSSQELTSIDASLNPKPKKNKGMKKLSPKLGRKKEKNNGALNYPNQPAVMNSNFYHDDIVDTTLPDITYKFLEIHNHLRKQIEMFVSNQESSV